MEARSFNVDESVIPHEALGSNSSVQRAGPCALDVEESEIRVSKPAFTS